MDPTYRETIAGRYELLDLIGQGGQALVFRARDNQTEESVAIKMMMRDSSGDPSWVERMAREQQAMVELAGTGAVGYKDLCTSNSGALCLVMELLDGRDLEQVLQEYEQKREFLPLSEVVRLMTPIVDTLEKAHAVGIVHRDLKPGNMFIPKDPEATTRLLDFGLARSKSSRQVTAAGTILGSPSYIAPEMWLSQGSAVDPRVDVYSLGVILFRLLGGRLPFLGDNLQQKFIAITTSERPSLHALRPDLSPNVDIWVERALALDPSDRFPSVRASFGELLWALGLAPHPSQQKRVAVAKRSEVRRIRAWLEAPFQTIPNTIGAALRAAQGALGKLKRFAFAVPDRQPKSDPVVEPSSEASPEPPAVQASAQQSPSATFQMDISGTRPARASEPLLHAENTNAVAQPMTPESLAKTVLESSSDRLTLAAPEVPVEAAARKRTARASKKTTKKVARRKKTASRKEPSSKATDKPTRKKATKPKAAKKERAAKKKAGKKTAKKVAPRS